MQPMTFDAALLLSPGKSVYRELEDGTLQVVETLRHYDGYVTHTRYSQHRVKDGVAIADPNRIDHEAYVWLPLETLYTGKGSTQADVVTRNWKVSGER